MKLITNKSAIVLGAFTSLFSSGYGQKSQSELPNILWITCEDISPYLGCYGFAQARTPHLDKLAERGIRFTHAYSNAPVSAVARSTILSGMYATTLGTHNMRSRTQLPEIIPVYPKILREAGYYCTNNAKKDYNSNFENDNTIWDESSKSAHYSNRKPGQPFFAVFNNTVTHESQLSENRIKKYIENNQIPGLSRVNPADIILPPYHPDLPEIKQDWARLHDLITLMDHQTGEILRELEKSGLADNTIVFFYSDHGGQLARSKRYIYNVGTQIPFILYLPPKWQHLSEEKPGDTNNQMVSFVDLAKTVLSITGCDIPELMQGHNFLGAEKDKDPGYVHFYRDRMSERYDFSRAVTDGRYYFIRNFMPHRPRGRDTRYGFNVQSNWRSWENFFEAGKCNDIQSQFFNPKPLLELFDTGSDPWHVTNLAEDPEYAKISTQFSDELDRWMIETRDIGLIPEPMFHELVGEGKKHSTIYEFAQSEDYPIDKILNASKKSTLADKDNIEEYLKFCLDRNPIVRFWGAYALFLTKMESPDVQSRLMSIAENDIYAANRIIAAQALAVCGNPDIAFKTIMREATNTKNPYLFLFALNAFQYSNTDVRLTLDDWKSFKEKSFAENDAVASLGYHQRIISDAIDLWPKRRKVY